MAVDASKLVYLSAWDIDQQLSTAELAVGSGTTTLYTISGSVTLPVFKVQFKPSGSTFYFDNGFSSTDATLAGLFTFYSYISGTSLIINTPTTGTARYFVWADKFNY